jgi:hypothetical protein
MKILDVSECLRYAIFWRYGRHVLNLQLFECLRNISHAYEISRTYDDGCLSLSI